MSKEKKFIDAGKNVASSIFQKRNEYEEAHKEEVFVIEQEPEEEKKLISPDNFGGGVVSNDTKKDLGIENEPVLMAVKSNSKVKAPTKKELEEQKELENEKVDIFAGIMTMGGTLKPSLIKEEEPVEEEPIEEVEEEEIDYSYDVTSQFYTQAVKPVDKSPKK